MKAPVVASAKSESYDETVMSINRTGFDSWLIHAGSGKVYLSEYMLPLVWIDLELEMTGFESDKVITQLVVSDKDLSLCKPCIPSGKATRLGRQPCISTTCSSRLVVARKLTAITSTNPFTYSFEYMLPLVWIDMDMTGAHVDCVISRVTRLSISTLNIHVKHFNMETCTLSC
ncbi:hypothetical protein TSUD_251190 [Trifolium subterraneum]|uniref:Uncharacterized protein n=1 Tax=Trifolium subterraneum TaxID=3900 RepID=A0A2Z6LSC5_TRISU|nr:hypothetical protein TSUD_251190 [Trifolium subterraneum]